MKRILFFLLIFMVSCASNNININRTKYELVSKDGCFQNYNGCEVQWASRVIDYSSKHYNKTYSSKKILERPTLSYKTGYNDHAWIPGQADSTNEFITVGFQKPMEVSKIIIFENLQAGAITKITLYDKDGDDYEVLERDATKEKKGLNILKYNIEQTDFKVYALRVDLDCSVNPGDESIDAIGISNSNEEFSFDINISSEEVIESEPERLSDSINTSATEALPIISPDGKTLYFVRNDYSKNFGSSNMEDIWYSERHLNGKWGKAKQMPRPLNNEQHNAILSITPDGNTVLLNNIYLKNGKMRGGGKSMAHRTKDGWSFPETIDFKKYYNKSKITQANLSNNGKIIVQSLEMDDSYGALDLYVSFLLDNGQWTAPKNLGKTINTSSSEITPFLSADNKTLYFSSNGFPSFGSTDVYLSKRLDDTWTNWSEPENLNKPLNSDSFDAYFNIPASGEYSYLSRYNVKNMSRDIYRMKVPGRAKPDPVVLLSGKVFDTKKNKAIAAIVRYEDLETGEEVGVARSNPETGEYKIVLPAGRKYSFRAEAEDFLSVNENIDLTEIEEYKEQEVSLKLAPIEKGIAIRLNNVFFEFGKSILLEESNSELNRISKILLDNPKIKIEISGHTDNIGSDSDNLKLSDERAQAVRDYLVNSGILNERIVAKGYGELVPVADNDSDEGRQKNRRVEFKIIEK